MTGNNLSRIGMAIIATAVILGTVTVSYGAGAAAEEYKSKAQKTKLLYTKLDSGKDLEARVIRFDLPPGYVGGKHYHPGDVFVYVQKGSFTVKVDGETYAFKAGEVYSETPNVPMLASNGSTTEETTIIVFQVGAVGEPVMVKAE